ncbi:hypothetical protein [Streptomonospora salina]|uniref:Uncharacterized protein n=1 Tax=Streptomonospora salina TaxID=104205 RepID=A0A841DZY2_9ACTN|nr:hypothetical protein [Streptomonospora salina]MBB5997037.1 hypothetical protein [Streptomonospora salina]
MNFKPPQTARNPHVRTFKVDDNFRGVVYAPEGGGTLVLLKVLPHDDAYAWARKLDAAANPVTRGLEIWNADALERVTPTRTRRSPRSSGGSGRGRRPASTPPTSP